MAADHRIAVQRIDHSVKTRARQTAEIFADALSPAEGIREIKGIKPMDDAAAFACELRPEDNVMVVGHLPFMSRLTALLICNRVEPPVFRFQNSGIVCLDKPNGEKTG
jgi:phosphohistidine phosphatase